MISLKKAAQAMKAYSTLSRDQGIRLDSNESDNFLFDQPIAFDGEWERYPENHAETLKHALASELNVSPEQLLIGNGSSEILDWAIKSIVNPGHTVLTAGPTFSMYKFYATLHDTQYKEVPLNDDFTFPETAFLEAIKTEQPELIILCSPNNPTGGQIPHATLLKIIQATNVPIIIDEAYYEFTVDTKTWIDEVETYPHIIVTRTFSKAFGLASIRLGYAVTSAKNVTQLNRTKTPYNVNALSQFMGLKALEKKAAMAPYIASVRKRRDALKVTLESFGFTVYPSNANFLLTEHALPDLTRRLRDKNILIRPFDLGRPFYRITIGTESEVAALIQALKEIIDEANTSEKDARN